MTKKTTACFSGYRPKNFSFALGKGDEAFLALHERTGQAIIQAVSDGYNRFMCGMAEGFDLIAGSVFLELKEKRSDMANVQLLAMLPFAGHGFSEPWGITHQLILRQAEEVITLAPKYHPPAYHDRNRYMVDNSSCLICYYNGKKGGTRFTVKYAGACGLSIINIAAPEFEIG